MNVLFDTNVVLDVLLERKPFFQTAQTLFSWVEEGILTGFLGATTITTVFYLSNKAIGNKNAHGAISKLLALFSVAPVNRSVLENALTSEFADFEDAVLYQSAAHAGVQAIITRDGEGFRNSKIAVYTPDEFVKMTKALK